MAAVAEPKGFDPRGRLLRVVRPVHRDGKHPAQREAGGRRGDQLRNREEQLHRRSRAISRQKRARLDVHSGRQNGEPSARRQLPADSKAAHERDQEDVERRGAGNDVGRERQDTGGGGRVAEKGSHQVSPVQRANNNFVQICKFSSSFEIFQVEHPFIC